MIEPKKLISMSKLPKYLKSIPNCMLQERYLGKTDFHSVLITLQIGDFAAVHEGTRRKADH